MLRTLAFVFWPLGQPKRFILTRKIGAGFVEVEENALMRLLEMK